MWRMKSLRSIVIWCILRYLRFFARVTVKRTEATIIGIAGSVGKSSTRNAISTVLKEHGKTVVVSGNSETGVPLGILGIPIRGYRPWHWLAMLAQAAFKTNYLLTTKYLVIEMGTDDIHTPKNMSYLLSIVKPHIAVWLNVAPTHMMQFGDGLTGEASMNDVIEKALQRMAEEDGKIVTESGCQTAIYNANDSRIADVIQNAQSDLGATKLLSYGTGGTATITTTSYAVTPDSTRFEFELHQQEQTIPLSLEIKNHILPQEYQEVFAATLLVGVSLHLPLPSFIDTLQEQFELPKGRASLFKGINNSLIIDSTYNSSPVPLRAFLTLARQLREQTKRPIIFLFGDMNELGTTAEFEHTQIAKEISDIDVIYCVGPQTKEYALPLLKHAQWFATAHALGVFLQQKLPTHALVLAKGSQNRVYLEEAIKPLLADATDAEKLCRQEPYWLETKRSGNYL